MKQISFGGSVDRDSIDASLGLALSLELFKQYKRSGTLKAEIRKIPDLRGPGTAFLSLVDGIVVASFFEDKRGQRYSAEKDKLIQLDSEKGPFAWSFHPAVSPKIIPTQQSPSTSQPLSLRHISSQNMERQMPIFADSGVAKIIAPLEIGSLGNKWTIAQKQMLVMVWRLIDGRRTLREIKTILGSSLSETTVDEILSALVRLRVITIEL